MVLKRVIPVVLVKDGLLVRSQIYKYHQAIGDPIPTIKRLSDWDADEIVILNIGKAEESDSRREDKYHNIGISNFSNLVKITSQYCHCPVTIGGGIRTANDVGELFSAGADKIIVNTLCYERPDLIRHMVQKYGSQAITASIDIKTSGNRTTIWTQSGTINTGHSLKESLKYMHDLGVGEILISSIDYDGSAKGYDPQILDILEDRWKCPIIVNSGATENTHFLQALALKGVSAVAASNIFYFTELSYPNIKKEIINKGYKNIRSEEIDNTFTKREPIIDINKRSNLLSKALCKNEVSKDKYKGDKQLKPRFCRRCLYSSASATPMQFDESGLCMGCRVYEEKARITGNRYEELRKTLIRKINLTLTESTKSRNYDCIVSVSGGKDSYYQTHYVKEVLGLKPLLVTYNGNNYSEIGWRNLWNMRSAFNCDHIVVSPSVQTLKKLNYWAFVAMGDMNWHAHMGIFTTAPRIAVQQGIPIIFWGEHGYADLCGQFNMTDFPEMNYRERTEHAGRGFDWTFFEGVDSITSQDMEPWKYPNDKELMELNLKQIYLGHYIPWESNRHLELVKEKYGFEVSKEPFERTYRRGSNLDDIHENGIHDYLKYIKFGYGRCTDHASKDIRSGDLSREEGIKLTNAMDPIKPNDLKRWLDYVKISEQEFDRIADYFRDPRVWKWDESSGWCKDSLKG